MRPGLLGPIRVAKSLTKYATSQTRLVHCAQYRARATTHAFDKSIIYELLKWELPNRSKVNVPPPLYSLRTLNDHGTSV